MRKVGKHRICRELITLDCGVASLTEFREIDLAPFHLADFREAAGDRQIDRAHGNLKTDVFLGEVAAIVSITENDHGPCAEEEMASMGNYHFAVENLIDRILAPVKPTDQHILSRHISPFAQGRHRAKRHWIVRCPQRVDTRTRLNEFAHRLFCGRRGPFEVSYVDQSDRTWAEQLGHHVYAAIQALDTLQASGRPDVSGERKNA